MQPSSSEIDADELLNQLGITKEKLEKMRGSESTVQELSDLVEKLMPKDGSLDVDFIHV